ncbi:unnamed protein product [Aureobasidium mustum]|uniref:BTB domain-containing protein n=1 Tax=Aureobasidium mustum TaxID=2773714 RepID=A0A9N8KE44_9PEZI|nr:unnamed protein product [Aureobasidium mustum]
MDDKDFINGDNANPTVFNNPKDSDIILEFGCHQVYAHRAILRMCLNSQFPVATSAVFNIVHDSPEDLMPIYAMLKHVYGMPSGIHPKNTRFYHAENEHELMYSIRVYMLSDIYDVPSARNAAISAVKNLLDECTGSDTLGEEDHRAVAECVMKLCGPGAPQLADSKLRNTLFSWLSDNFHFVTRNPEFKAKIENGSLLDTELTAKLLFALSAQIASPPRKKRRVQTVYLRSEHP